jgi:hypothetical protein
MKKISCILFGLLCLTGYAQQPYKSYFGETYTKWNIVSNTRTVSLLTCCERTFTIDDKEYYSLFKVYESEDEEITSVDINEPSVYFLREEPETGRLYYRELRYTGIDVYTPEYLVSDMSLRVGDSIRFSDTHFWHLSWDNLIEKDNMVYALVDSVYYQHDLKHIRTNVHFFDFLNVEEVALTFIEGIGANVGPLIDYSEIGAAYDETDIVLSCYHRDGDITTFSEQGCIIFTLGIEDNPSSRNVTYNVREEMLAISFPDFFTGTISLYETTGIMRYKANVTNESAYTINIKHLQQGFYILWIENESGKPFAVKIKI